jgi:hypothetical protein
MNSSSNANAEPDKGPDHPNNDECCFRSGTQLEDQNKECVDSYGLGLVSEEGAAYDSTTFAHKGPDKAYRSEDPYPRCGSHSRQGHPYVPHLFDHAWDMSLASCPTKCARNY